MSNYIECPICGQHIRRLKSHWNYNHKDIDYNKYLEDHPETDTLSTDYADLISSKISEKWNDGSYDRDHISRSMSERVSYLWKNDDNFIEMRREVSSRTMKKIITEKQSDEDYCSRRNKLLSDKWKDPEYRTLHSKISSDTMKRTHLFHKCGGSPDKYKGTMTKSGVFNFRSSLEVRISKLLDLLDVRYDYESDRFEYKYNNETHIYITDLKIRDYYIEIKPKKLWNDDRVRSKLTSVRSLGFRIYLVDSYDDLIKVLIEEGSTTIEKVDQVKDLIE